MKRAYKITLIVVAALIVLVLAVAVAVSPVTKNYIEKHDRELLGRSIRMERLRINIFTGRLRVEGLRIGGTNDSTVFFALDSFDMRMRILPLLSNRVMVKHLHFTAPDIKVYQQGSAFSFDDILRRFASADTVAAAEEPSKPWEIGLYDIRIRKGRIFYKDLELDAIWGLNDIDLQIPGVYFGGEKTDVGAVLNFAEGGSLATSVAYDIASSEFDIGLKLKDLTLTGMLPYFRQSLDIGSVAGRLSADIRLRGDTEHLLSLRTEGTASLAGFSLTDMQQRPVAGVDTLGMQLAEGDLGKMRFRFDRLYVGGFSLLAELTPQGDNLSALMKPSPETPAASAEPVPEAAASEGGPTLQIADLEIAGGRVTLRDLTMNRPFEYAMTDIRMRSRNFDPSARNNLQIEARMQRTGQAKLRWEGTLDNLNNQNITLWLSNLDLRDFSPYCEHFTAYPLTRGNLTFRSQNVIRNRYLDGTNHLDVFEPRVDKKRKDLKPEMNIPLKLGLYVLKDKKGHVKMDLPVGGNLDSPEFSYRKIVLKAIGNVLLKVVTAPFSFLSGSRDNLEYIPVDPAQYAFTSEQYASFDQIAQMLKDKPEIQIALTQRINLTRALPAQAANALRLAYHNSLAAADSTGQRPQLSMLEYEKLQQIDIRTPAVAAFADSLLSVQGRSPQGMSPDTKALALYREQALGLLRRMMAARDKALAEYMFTTHGVQPPSFRLQPLDSLALAAYTGRDRYTIALGVDGETIEIGEEQPAEPDAAGTTAESGAGTTANPPAIPADSLPATTPAAPVPATSVSTEATAGNASAEAPAGDAPAVSS
ncbi:DUF748 domain-containing protein [Alistipes sp. kh20]|uniref:DUF748 domain-containing protein n=1 Tax=Alistipes montrealensis TaxID=2834113 RepID=UPI001BCD33CE|nr:DUF748 domain-containing protein [Alistipes montrealensis]MBS4766109.1 DUF748 domain-containing protein [Alistipes montrealensis]